MINVIECTCHIRMKQFFFRVHTNIFCRFLQMWVHQFWPPRFLWFFISHFQFSLLPFFLLPNNQVCLIFLLLLLLKFIHGFYKNVQLKLISSLLQSISLATQFIFIFESDPYSLLSLFWPAQQDSIISHWIVSV